MTIAGVGAIFIDDIVLPDGQAHMGRLGGGVIHALMGAALWDERPCLVALAGHDLAPEIIDHLRQHLDLSGLRLLDLPQIRAWQIFEHDGTRRELYRVAETQPFIAGAQPHHLPDSCRDVTGLYLLQDFSGVRRWRDHLKNTLILWEPLQQIMTPANSAQFRQTLQTGLIDIVSPNLAEAQAIYGSLLAADLLAAMLDDGAKIAALRMGAQGSLVGNQTGEYYHIPALTVTSLFDQTGAGNVYCGAFLTGVTRGKSLCETGAMAAVAASFCLEQIGVLEPNQVSTTHRDERFHLVLSGINQ